MLLAEDILLLATDDDSGRKLARYTDLLVAGGLLSDLALAGNIRVTEAGESIRKKRMVSVPEAPWPADPLLGEALTVLSGKPNWFLSMAVDRLSRKLIDHKPVDEVYERLARAELVSRTTHRVLGLVPTTRWVSVDGRYEAELREEFDAVLLFGAAPDPHIAALIALLSGAGLLVQVVDRGRGVDRRALRRQGKQLLKQYWPAQAMERAFQSRDAAAAG
ncbi:MAG: GPP34 family phosphoprotein [Micropruina sp.]|uniref:GOLPH3/VPS74 family protein n=1 Tax=Micropruina sp. TaxID=2737536 RepID=UPI0039E2609C